MSPPRSRAGPDDGSRADTPRVTTSSTGSTSTLGGQGGAGATPAIASACVVPSGHAGCGTLSAYFGTSDATMGSSGNGYGMDVDLSGLGTRCGASGDIEMDGNPDEHDRDNGLASSSTSRAWRPWNATWALAYDKISKWGNTATAERHFTFTRWAVKG